MIFYEDRFTEFVRQSVRAWVTTSIDQSDPDADRLGLVLEELLTQRPPTDYEIWLALDRLTPDTVEMLREDFANLVPEEEV